MASSYKKSVTKAYRLWLLSGFGWFAFHRLYLRKNKTALLWICTFGLFGIGAIADLFLLRWLVKRYNMVEDLKELQTELIKTIQWKEQLVQNQKFEEAAYNRDKEIILKRKIDKLRKSLIIKK
jgi:TM2 domain-containing membrane protein YozV